MGRTMRLLKLLRMSKVLRLRKELMVLMEGLWASFKALAWVFLFMGLLIYTSAVLCRNIITPDLYTMEPGQFNTLDVDRLFGSMSSTMLTLFNIAVLDEWGTIVRPVAQVQPHVALFFMLYLGVNTLGVLNLVIGVMSERTLSTAMELKEQEHLKLKRTKMKEIIRMADDIFTDSTEKDGLSVEALDVAAEEHPGLLDTIQGCELPRGFQIKHLHLMFDEEFNNKITKGEFI